MIKKIIFTLILVLSIGASSFAQTNIITIDDALNKVGTTGTINLFDYSITRLNSTYENISDIVEMIPVGLLFSTDSQILSNLGLPYLKKDRLEQVKFVYVEPQKMLSAIESLKNTKKLTENSIKLGVIDVYNGIVMLEEAIKLQQEALEVSNLQLNNANEKFNNGTISNNELKKIVLENEKSKINIDIQKRKQQNLKYTLNKMIGNDIDSEFGVHYDLTKPEKVPLNDDISGYIDSALSNRAEIKAINEDIKNIDKEIFFTGAFYGEDELQYKIANLKLKLAKENLVKMQNEIRYEIENAYESVQLKYNKIEECDINYQNAVQKYDDMKSKYDSGLITKDILDSIHILITSEKLNLLSSINDYNSSLVKFSLATGIGPKFN